QYEPGKILSIISREKGNMVTVDEYETRDEFSYAKEAAVVAWRGYEKALKENKSLDFDDLIFKAAVLLRDHEDVRTHYQNVWKYVHVDEYQDTNEVQYLITKLLAESHHNLCVVGDGDQNIYTWRGATIKNILNFEKDYPEAKEILLEQNYRSTQNILGAANDVIKKNKNRREKNLFTENVEGDKITIYNAYDENDEANYIAETALELVNNKVDPKEIAVLYRANFQSRVLEEAFLNRLVPYQVLGTRFFDRKEIKDVLSYIQTAMNPSDRASLARTINTPARGIGKVSLLKVLSGKEEDLKGKAKENVASFKILIKTIRHKIDNENPGEVIKFVLQKSGLEEYYKKLGDDGLERIENVKELVTLSTKYDELEKPDGINKLLEDSALASDQDELQKDNGGVKLMTVHASKGLEFDYIFVTGLESGLFPHERMDEKKDDDEEERRLFYVALTRARTKLILTYANIRTIFGSQQINAPSEFIGDIDASYIEEERDNPTSSAVKDIFIDF
ncbi:MAG: DNA helicase-2/ATP-dependent DNA helicase PcrA, partial [Candidatus Paceibacteria bacterium]